MTLKKREKNMFSAKTYRERREELVRRIGSGLILIAGNTFSPNNYPNNAYYFRQDSTFLYYFGLNVPTLFGVIDADTGESSLFGDDFTVDDIIWTGPQPKLVELGAQVGVAACPAYERSRGCGCGGAAEGSQNPLPASVPRRNENHALVAARNAD